MNPPLLSLFVEGTPKSKGSFHYFRGRVVNDKKQMAWETHVKSAIKERWGEVQWD